ncbi:hypothetical protein SIAM614_00305 [Stappia aggregata IAM 12614]|uniref:Uncharacterized protein n=1 Tax=Roseibium aggregatum (strain ATCC 25650 / DSM 13394 / JCM 20685 / NBRC 16684 / NCIMB 2208 / IAM 12614 / B1) TaxID=384765 RepID=A0P407_ROSAI|nr:hypothetical protein SIAM614_00305 [Stappia aggregata IAM 12614] [Roseibium aggregatum IAM 12614]
MADHCIDIDAVEKPVRLRSASGCSSIPRLHVWKNLSYVRPPEQRDWSPGHLAPQIVDRICTFVAAKIRILFMI